MKTEEKHKFKDKESWQAALNCAPNNNWIKSRSLGAGRTSKYIPIERQQGLADYFFDECDVFDEKYTNILNEILCTVKISILPSYPNSEQRIISGTGAKAILCKSGSMAENFPKGKISNSLEFNAPAARAAAISNALSTFGNVFGRNLGRAVSAGFNLANNKRKE